MNKYITYSETEINNMLQEILRQMWKDNFKPEIIVGLVRGGVVPAVKLSHYMNCKMHTLSVSLRDHVDRVSDCGLSEMAAQGKKILIVDDIMDSGDTFRWIKQDWPENEGADPAQWDKDIWNKTVKFAALVSNESSKMSVDYSGQTMNRVDQPDSWYVFPWERWW